MLNAAYAKCIIKSNHNFFAYATASSIRQHTMAMATAPNNNIIVESNCAWSDDVLDFLQGIDVDAGTAWEDDADAAHPDAKRAKVNHGRVGNTAARRKVRFRQGVIFLIVLELPLLR